MGRKFVDGNKGGRLFAKLLPDGGEEFTRGTLAKAGYVADIFGINNNGVESSFHKQSFGSLKASLMKLNA